MTYPEAIQFLYDLRLFGTKLGLENTRKLAALAGNPQDTLRFIHVAGTNGKGSTCAMLESIYRAAGLRMGLFTSPHLVAFGERMQINRRPIAETEVVRLVREVQALLPHFPPEAHPTFFEVITVMALRYFAEQHCDLVIWETGLGGRLDATNIVTPLASVITNIQYDHQKWLGHTLEQIAFEKAGIIKPAVPVITAAMPRQGLEVVVQVAGDSRSPLRVVTETEIRQPPLDTLQLPLRGEHQRLNAALALATVEVLQSTWHVSSSHVVAGLSQIDWPGRLQFVTLPGRTILLDGAHNLPGAQTLVHELAHGVPPADASLSHGSQKPAIIFGVMADKDWENMGVLLAQHAGRLLLVPINSQRSLPPEQLAPLCRQANRAISVEVCASLEEALRRTESEPFVAITGSLYLVGEALQLLHLSAAPVPDEHRLNEWNAGDGARK